MKTLTQKLTNFFEKFNTKELFQTDLKTMMTFFLERIQKCNKRRENKNLPKIQRMIKKLNFSTVVEKILLFWNL